MIKLDAGKVRFNTEYLGLEQDADGVYRWVVAHRDPGIYNWVDTTGLDHGYLTIRWTYNTPPPRQDWPVLKVRKVHFDQLDEYFPSGRRNTSADQRAADILLRHRHVQRRYRQY